MTPERYNAHEAELRWQQVWERRGVLISVSHDSRPRDGRAMFPCAPGRIDIEHLRNATMRDVMARYKRTKRFGAGSADARACGENVTIGSMGKRSKSRRQIVDPDDIFGTYGADAARWFMLSNSPPERDVTWTDEGLHGAWRFVQRLWRLIGEAGDIAKFAPTARPAQFGEAAIGVRKAAHRAVANLSDDIEAWRFNRCVAHIHECVNALSTAIDEIGSSHDGVHDNGGMTEDFAWAMREAAEILVNLFNPMMPHLAEECWAVLGHTDLVAEQPWPEIQPSLLIESRITLPVQVNGKKRADVTVTRNATSTEIETAVLALDAVQKALNGGVPKKVIVVPQRIVNVVA